MKLLQQCLTILGCALVTCWFAFGMFATYEALAHSGGTDSSGGHYNRKTGQYHYHGGASYDYEPDPKPRHIVPKAKPVKKKKTKIKGYAFSGSTYLLGAHRGNISLTAFDHHSQDGWNIYSDNERRLQVDGEPVIADVLLFIQNERLQAIKLAIPESDLDFDGASSYYVEQLPGCDYEPYPPNENKWTDEEGNTVVVKGTVDQTFITYKQPGVHLPDFTPPDEQETATFAGQVYQVNEVVDGDTVKLNMGSETVTLGLLGVDAPDAVHPNSSVELYAKEAYDFLRNLLTGEMVRVEEGTDTVDEYGLKLFYLYREPDGLFVNAEIIRQGFGHALKEFPHTHMESFRDFERQAREKERGLWSQDVTLEIEPEFHSLPSSGEEMDFGVCSVWLPASGSVGQPGMRGWDREAEVIFEWYGGELDQVKLIMCRVDDAGHKLDEYSFRAFASELTSYWGPDGSFDVLNTVPSVQIGGRSWNLIEVADRADPATTVYYSVFSTYQDTRIFTLTFYYLNPVMKEVQQFGKPVLRSLNVN